MVVLKQFFFFFEEEERRSKRSKGCWLTRSLAFAIAFEEDEELQKCPGSCSGGEGGGGAIFMHMN